MKKIGLIVLLLIVAIAMPSISRAADALGYKDTPLIPGTQWHIHDTDRPHPPIITPGTASTPDKPGQPPSDAIVLFDGKDLSQWTNLKGEPTKWEIKDGAMVCVPKSGFIQSKQKFGDAQVHIEFNCPTPPKGNSQGRGNSGVFLGGGMYEIQVLDSYDNVTYADGQCCAMYGQHPPQVNSSRKPGEWQSYDIIYHMPKFENGKMVKPANVTIFQNGVLMQYNQDYMGGTNHKQIKPYKEHAEGALQFQDHGNPVAYRNVWVRELKKYEDQQNLKGPAEVKAEEKK